MPKRIDVLTPAWVDWDVHLLRGVQEYGDRVEDWSVRYVPRPQGMRAGAGGTGRERADGLIIMPGSRGDSSRMARVRLPKVFAFEGPAAGGHAVIKLDHAAIGRVGAEHLLACRFSRLAFYGTANVRSRVREQAFCEVAQAARVEIQQAGAVGRAGSRGKREEWRPDWMQASEAAFARRFLQTLRPPVGVMCYHDAHAGLLIGEAMAAGWAVPEEVAVLGVDNYELECLYRPVTISSVDVDIRRVGFESARALHQAMGGRRGWREDCPMTLIPPRGVVRRMSTDVHASEDLVVRRALGLIRASKAQVSVKQLAGAMRLSRRMLEQRFAAAVGQAPAAYLRSLRLERARELLFRGDAPVESVAQECGFAHAAHLTTAFKKAYALTPAQYRAREQMER